MLKVPLKKEYLQRNCSQSISYHSATPIIPQPNQSSLNARSNSICLEKSDIMKFVSDAFRSTKMDKKRGSIDSVKFGNRTTSDLLSNFKKQNLVQNVSNINNLVKKRQKKSVNLMNENLMMNSLQQSKNKQNSVKIDECGNKLRQKILIRVLKPKQTGENMNQAIPEHSFLLTKEERQKLNGKSQDLNFLNTQNLASVQRQVGEKPLESFGKNLLSNLNRRKKYSSFGGQNFMKIRI